MSRRTCRSFGKENGKDYCLYTQEVCGRSPEKEESNQRSDILANQLKKFRADRCLIQDVLTSSRRTVDDFTYYWALVNSRCYYWKYAKSRKPVGGSGQRLPDECLALCPFADLFNHGNDGVCFFIYARQKLTMDSAISAPPSWVAR